MNLDGANRQTLRLTAIIKTLVLLHKINNQCLQVWKFQSANAALRRQGIYLAEFAEVPYISVVQMLIKEGSTIISQPSLPLDSFVALIRAGSSGCFSVYTHYTHYFSV
jgi:hypothetical protein